MFPQHQDLPGNDGYHVAPPPPFVHFLQTILIALRLGIRGIARTVMLDKDAGKKEDEDDDSVQCAHPPEEEE